MGKTAIIYGSSTGNTKHAAEKIAEGLSGIDVTLLDVASFNVSDIESYDNLILGTSTWGFGDLQDDWDNFISKLAKADLTGKKVALFGLGDSGSYPDTFVDGMGILYDTIKDKGISLIGSVSTDGYSFDASRAEKDGEFVGLPLDEDNDPAKTDERISSWTQELQSILSDSLL